MGRLELGLGGSRSPGAASEWPSPQGYRLTPSLSPFRTPCRGGGGGDAGGGFPPQKPPGLSEALADPSDVSSGFAFEEPAAQDFQGLPGPCMSQGLHWPPCCSPLRRPAHLLLAPGSAPEQ